MASLAWGNATKMLPSNRDPGPAGRVTHGGWPQTLRPALWVPPLQLAWLQLLALPFRGEFEGRQHRTHPSSAITGSMGECQPLHWVYEWKSETAFPCLEIYLEGEGSMTGQTSLRGFCIGVYWSTCSPRCLKEPNWIQSRREWVHILIFGLSPFWLSFFH